MSLKQPEKAIGMLVALCKEKFKNWKWDSECCTFAAMELFRRRGKKKGKDGAGVTEHLNFQILF